MNPCVTAPEGVLIKGANARSFWSPSRWLVSLFFAKCKETNMLIEVGKVEVETKGPGSGNFDSIADPALV